MNWRKLIPPVVAFLVVAGVMAGIFWGAESSKGFESWTTRMTGWNARGSEVTMTVRVTSTGTETLPTTCVAYLSTRAGIEVGQGSANVPPVSPGRSVTVTIPVPLHRPGIITWYWIECAGE